MGASVGEGPAFALPAGTVTFLLTDIEGSTRWWETAAEAMPAAVARHYELLDEAISRHAGVRPVEQGEGDSVVAAFGRAGDAVAAALDAQRALMAEEWPGEVALRIRMALHTGDAQLRDGGNYFGAAVIRCARLRALAHGGQVLLSGATHDLVCDRLPDGVELVDLGAHRLRDLDRPEHVWALAHPDLPSGFEPLRSLDAPPNNLPVELSTFVGRERELGKVGELFATTRLLTLTGPGGAGKTRLAVKLARRQTGRRRDGVWLVDLTSADADPAAEAARTLDVGGRSTASPTESLRRYLADRHVLLVLDNCEHVIESCAELATAVLSSCGDVRILATSREPLGVAGETVWRLEPLEAEDAQRLFVERARQREPRFIPTEEDDATIAALCARLDHLPLAIELAAARVGVMSPAEILAGFEARLDTLGTGPRLAPPRHRTVRAAVEWSYALLDPVERRAFRALAVFAGGFDAAAATSVAPGLTRDVLARLVDKSIVATVETTSGTTRYRLLETVRELAHELLVEAGELDAARERHLDHFSVHDDVELDGWPSERAEAILDEFEHDYGNARDALEWAAAAHADAGARMLVARRDLFLMLGQADGRRLAQLLLERRPARDRLRAELLITAGLLAMFVGDRPGAASAHAAARELSAELGEARLEGWAHFFHGLSEMLGGSPLQARAHLEAGCAIHRRAGIRIGVGVATAALGLTHAMAGEPARGRELLEEALALQVEAGYRWGQGQTHLYLGLVALAGGTDSRASDHFRAAVDCLRPYRDSTLLPQALIGEAAVLRHRDAARALRVTAAAWTIRSRTGGEFAPFFRERAVEVRAACEAALGTDAARIWGEGTRLGVDATIALAFGARTPPSTSAPGGLSARELEVVRLVASGHSNKAIASDLQLSVRTVESHVRHALAKVGLDNRTQLAAWAHEHGH